MPPTTLQLGWFHGDSLQGAGVNHCLTTLQVSRVPRGKVEQTSLTRKKNMSKCMEKYRNDFIIKFARLMQVKLLKWKNLQKEEIKSLYSIGSIGLYLGVSLFAFIPGKNEHNYNLEMHCILAVVFFISAIIGNIHITNKTYQDSVKSTFFNELLKVFGENIFYIDKSFNYIDYVQKSENSNREILAEMLTNNDITIPNNVFDSSQLYSQKITSRENDDQFFGVYNDVCFKMCETDFGYDVNTSKGKRYYSMFKGIAMDFKMNKQIKSCVLIMSKNILNKIPKNYEKVVVEYEKFNKKYDVWVEKTALAGSGQIEARYLLNTVFLDRFMQLQTSFRVNKMACSVYGDKMLVMLSAKKDLFEMNHLLGKVDDIKQYNHLFDEFASVLSFMDVLNLGSKTKL